MKTKLLIFLVILTIMLPTVLASVPANCMFADYETCRNEAHLPDYSTMTDCSYLKIADDEYVAPASLEYGLNLSCKRTLTCAIEAAGRSCQNPNQAAQLDCASLTQDAGSDCTKASNILSTNPYTRTSCETLVFNAATRKNDQCVIENQQTPQPQAIACDISRYGTFLSELNQFVTATNAKVKTVDNQKCMIESDYNSVKSLLDSFTSPLWSQSRENRLQICGACAKSCGSTSSTSFQNDYSGSALKCLEPNPPATTPAQPTGPSASTIRSYNEIQKSFDDCITQLRCLQAWTGYQDFKKFLDPYPETRTMQIDPEKMKLIHCGLNPKAADCTECGLTAGNCMFRGTCIKNSHITPGTKTCQCVGDNPAGNPYEFDGTSCVASLIPQIKLQTGETIPVGIDRLYASCGFK